MNAAKKLGLGLGVLGLLGLLSSSLSGAPTEALPAPSFDRRFWDHWSDGLAELCGYELTSPRYGHARKGTAVSIFVTETFSRAARVKTDAPSRPDGSAFPVMKLNLVQDFQTGVYDYNLMSSAFVALQAFDSRPVGSAAKISFSAQEWCGHVYAQALFNPERLRLSSHSYFEGEADQSLEIAVPARGISEDLLIHWSRGFAAPALAPGESLRLPLLRSLEDSRLKHKALDWSEALLSRERELTEIEVPAGRFQCRLMKAEIKDRRSWSFWVEEAWPNRLVQWRSSEGHEGRLKGSARMKYWQLNAPGGEEALKKIGLK